MRAISLLEPWALLMALGKKKFETRSWKTSYRGELWIHASAGLKKEHIALRQQEPFRSALRDPEMPTSFIPFVPGAIIGRVELYDVQSTFPEGIGRMNPLAPVPSDNEYAFGDYSPNRYFFLTRNAMRLAFPVPVRGMLSIWEVPLEVELALKESKWI